MIVKGKKKGITEFVFEVESEETAYLMGSWDGWLFPGTPMIKQEGEPRGWRAAMRLSPGEHQFRYRIGNDWFNDSSADRYVDNGLGTDNSVVIVEEAPRKGQLKARRVPSGESHQQRKRSPKT